MSHNFNTPHSSPIFLLDIIEDEIYLFFKERQNLSIIM